MKVIGTIIGYIGLVVHVLFKGPKLAKPLYKAAWKLNSSNLNILSAYGLLLLREHDAIQAKVIFDRIIERNSNSSGIKAAKVNLTICLWKLGKIDEAIDGYEKLIVDHQDENYTLDSFTLDQIDAYIEHNPILSEQDFSTLGFYYLEKKDYEKSEFYTRAALKLNDKSSAAYDNLGQMYYKLKEFDEAKDYFIKALDYNNTLADSLYYLGLIYKREGNLEEAKLCFEKALKSKITGLNTVSKADIEKNYNVLK